MNSKDYKSELYWNIKTRHLSLDYQQASEDICLYIGRSLKDLDIKDFEIISGYVWGLTTKFYPDHHTWIEFHDGTILDVCSKDMLGVESKDLNRVDDHCVLIHRGGREEYFKNERYSINDFEKYIQESRKCNNF